MHATWMHACMHARVVSILISGFVWPQHKKYGHTAFYAYKMSMLIMFVHAQKCTCAPNTGHFSCVDIAAQIGLKNPTLRKSQCRKG